MADIESDPNDRALCAAVVSMANDLGIAIVAEGIENSAQEGFLRQKQETHHNYIVSDHQLVKVDVVDSSTIVLTWNFQHVDSPLLR